MRSPREFLSGEFLKVKYTRRLSTEYPPELRQVLGPIESTDDVAYPVAYNANDSTIHLASLQSEV